MEERFKDILLKIWILFSFVLIIGVVAYICLNIFLKGIGVISTEFILSRPEGLPLGQEGGIYPAIIGSIALMLLSMFFSSILAIATAIYLNFYCNSRLIKNIIEVIIQCIAGVPSIVLGLFGYTLFVLNLGLGRSLLSASLTLAIMIFSFIEVKIDRILAEINQELICTSYALGVSKYYMIKNLVLPLCRKDIISAMTLGGSLAIGASAPIILTGAVLFADIPKSIHQPIMALPFYIC